MKLLYTGNEESGQDIKTANHVLLLNAAGVGITMSGPGKLLFVVEFDDLETTAVHVLTFKPYIFNVTNPVQMPEISYTLPITASGNGQVCFELYARDADIISAGQLRMNVISGNDGDSSVKVQAKIYNLDPTDSDNYVAADIKELGMSAAALANLLAMYDGTGYAGGDTKLEVDLVEVNATACTDGDEPGRLDVNTKSVNGSSPITLNNIELSLKEILKQLRGRLH